MDAVMLVLFILFMFFIFSGYHRQKFEEREEERRLKEGESGRCSDATASDTKGDGA